MTLIPLILLLLVCLSRTLPTFESPELTVPTSNGLVVGKTVREGKVRQWLGIPYAAPPTGNNRFRAPQPVASWTATPRDAFAFGFWCTQWNMFAPDADMIGSEDCLYLNVWSPSSAAAGDKLPVIVIVHGGGQNIGSGGDTSGGPVLAQEYSHGDILADKNNAVVISFNFRLNAFGFLTLPALSVENGLGSSGGYGTLDQIQVLKWVKDNVLSFGGDPKKVGLMGISGGATGIATLVASPLAEDLFAAAWIGTSLINHASNKTTMEASYLSLLPRLNCIGYSSILTCLRGSTQLQIHNAFVRDVLATSISAGGVVNFPFEFGTPTPPIGGYILPLSPAKALANTNVNKKVTLILGNTNTEMTGALLGPGFVPSRDICTYFAFKYATAKTGHPLTSPALAAWVTAGINLYVDGPDSWLNCMSDIVYVCSGNSLANAAVEGDRDVYRYVFNYNVAPAVLPHAQHADDNLFLSGRIDYAVFLGPLVPTDFAYWLRQTMQEALITFASKRDVDYWPEYTAGLKKHLVFDDPLSIGTSYRAATCTYWNNPTL